ncbi:hypothetical protein ACRRTK_016343 [Alexandromys fortis]
MPRKKGAAWEEPSSGNGTARAGPRRRGGPAGRKRERPERCSSSSGGGSSGDEDGPELDGAPGGGKRAARPAAAGKAGGAAAVITEPEHTKERVVSGAGARAVGGWGEGRRGGHAPPLPPRRAGNSGELVPGRGSGTCVATRGLSLCRGCVLPPLALLPPPRLFLGEGCNPPGAAGSRRGFEVPAAAARAPRGGGAWRAARMLPGYSARSAGRCARGMVGARAGVSAHAPRRTSPPGGSPPPTRDPPQSGAGLCLPRVAAAWGRWGRPARAL